MAYGNNNFYGGYNPYNNYSYGGFNQPMANNPYQSQNVNIGQPQQAQQQVYLPLTFVNGINEAKMFIVQPNQTVYLRDNTAKDILYIKSVDSQGTPNIQIKRLVDAQEQAQQPTQPQIDLKDYVRKEDLRGFASYDDIQRLERKLEEITASKNLPSNVNKRSGA